MTEHLLHTHNKTCITCKQVLCITEFGRLKKSKDGLNTVCKTCARLYFVQYRKKHEAVLQTYQKNYRRENADSIRQTVKDWKLRKHGSAVAATRYYKFKLTQQAFDAMLALQNNVCDICKQPETYAQNGKLKSLCVDHNHVTGKIRKLLCHNCNRVLGLMGEDPERLRQAASYLERHND